MSLLFAKVWAWLCKWFAIAGALVLTIVTVGLYARKQGAKAQAQQDQAASAQAATESAQAAVTAATTRKDVDNEVAKLPESTAPRVLDADRGSAADKLAAEWMRGPSTPAADPGKAGSAD